MKPFAIELDDRALVFARNGEVLSSAPSAMFEDTVGAVGTVGTGRMDRTRQSTRDGANAWKALRSRPLAVSTKHLSGVLSQRELSTRSEALVAAELKERLSAEPIADGERVWIVSPARVEAIGLSALFGITRRLALPVDGFIDAAAVTVAALGLERSAIVLELGLHHAAATAVDSEGGQARRRRTVLAERAGFIELHQMWLDLVSTTMVKRTRFDPLHDAATEQQLFDALPSLARELAVSGDATAVVTKGAERFEVALTRDQFAQTADGVFRGMLGLVHQLRPAGAPVAIILPRAVAELPGLREHFEQFVGCELIGVPDGFAAAAASLMDLPRNTADDESVRLLRRVPLRTQGQGAAQGSGPPQGQGVAQGPGPPQVQGAQGPGLAREQDPPQGYGPTEGLSMAESVSREFLGKRRSGGASPSHVLLDGRAYALNAGALVVGRTPDKPEAVPSAPTPGIGTIPAPYRSITLPDGLAGVSRRHCTFVHDGDELVLLDHSTYGTFVNGERVHERVRIHAGDRVRLGEPGVELALIAVGDSATSPTQT